MNESPKVHRSISMYWWNMSKLADDLREGKLTEDERLKYYLATFLYGVCLFRYSFTMAVRSRSLS